MSTLKNLEYRLAQRKRSRRKHYVKWKRFKSEGKPVRAAYHRRKLRQDRKASVKLAKLIEAARADQIPRASGKGAWEGTKSVAREVEALVTRERGNVTGSQKRWEEYGNPDSDHHMSQENAYAIDFHLANDYAMAELIARHFNATWSGDYDEFIVVRGGRSFRIQIIAGTHGTGPHLHVGIRAL
jgi:hypothetical protein